MTGFMIPNELIEWHKKYVVDQKEVIAHFGFDRARNNYIHSSVRISNLYFFGPMDLFNPNFFGYYCYITIVLLTFLHTIMQRKMIKRFIVEVKPNHKCSIKKDLKEVLRKIMVTS